jgi:hypothetical protein
MAIKFNEAFSDLAKSAGLDLTKPEFAPILAIASEIPDDKAVMTLEVAKQHPEVIKHWKANFFNGVDTKINELASEYAFEPTEMEALKQEKDSYKRMKLLTQFTKAKTEKGFEGLSKTDKAQLVKEIEKLNADIVAVKEAAKKEVAESKAKIDDEITNYAFESSLRGRPYALKEIPEEININTSKGLIEKYMREKGAKLVRVGNELKLKNATTPDVDYIEDNKPVQYGELVNKILANNKLIAVTAPPDPKKGPTFKTKENTNLNDNRTKADFKPVANRMRENARQMAEANQHV